MNSVKCKSCLSCLGRIILETHEGHRAQRANTMRLFERWINSPCCFPFLEDPGKQSFQCGIEITPIWAKNSLFLTLLRNFRDKNHRWEKRHTKLCKCALRATLCSLWKLGNWGSPWPVLPSSLTFWARQRDFFRCRIYLTFCAAGDTVGLSNRFSWSN